VKPLFGINPLRLARRVAPAAAMLLSACATVPPNAGSNPRDPFERVNRHVFAFNERFDQYLAKPLAQGYVAVVPLAFRLCINSGFYNLLEIRNAVNDLLQIKPMGAVTDTGRLAINSTLGVFGCFDVASRMGLERRSQDFGLTLARWGAGTGPYLVLPLLGPSDVRDAIGLVPDNYLQPVSYVTPMHDRYILIGTSLIDTRAELLDASRLIEQAALDRYQFTRDAYFQRRRSKQYEGNPPPPVEEDDSGEAGPASGPAPSGTEQIPVQPTPEQRR
jgi:phospholipid-binding lipoprotein MlaA